MRVEIMDTTLRDGEQTCGVSFLAHEKMLIARSLLTLLGVDRIEVASARVSDGERNAVSEICRWASSHGMLERIEVLGFVDGNVSVDWIAACGGKVINLLCKGSLRHCEKQLGKTPQEHIDSIKETINYARSKGLTVNVYLEDWSNGMRHSREYVHNMINALKGCGIVRFMLPDTLGILSPAEVEEYMREMTRTYPEICFDFHAHNDYDLAAANVLAAVRGGAVGVHTCINGLGERAGNAPLASVQAILKDLAQVETGIDESRLHEVSHLVESYSGIPIPPNRPVVGENAFTQVAGVHADGDKKSNLYFNDLLPERFGRRREYALGKNSGKANILKNLENLGLELTPEQTRRVTDRIIELGDKKEIVTPEDLPYIVTDVLKHDTTLEEKVKLLSYVVSTAHGLRPIASVRLEINGKVYENQAAGDGQYDAFVRAVRHIYKDSLNISFPWLSNYAVTIPPGGRTDALVQTAITWEYNGRTIHTRGLDADQVEAAIKATVKMLNIIANEN
ncbi:MAG: 2-isopropylmalate synthase [Bacteroidales bacterium]|nr:2-isopropylmalate synthase [Bacteroidales bacterium]